MKNLFSCIFMYLVHINFAFTQSPPAHIVIVILENKSYSEIVGNPQAPYINSLLSNSHTALLTKSYAVTHPSQPNYLMLFSGSNQGVTNDNLPSNLPFTALNLGATLIKKGLSFTGYSEDLPSVGSTVVASGSYVRKHNPWVNWQGSGTNGIPAASNVPFSNFPTNYNLLPTLSIVVPNLDNDMHDGSIAAGDAWINTHLNGYIQWCITNNSLFILTFDEDDGSASNHILTFFTGKDIIGGSYSQSITHYNVLRTLEELYQLTYAGASATSSAITGIWLSLQSANYTFTGNGNWNVPANWLNNLMPPATTSPGSKIMINNAAGGQCILNISYTISPGTTLTVMPGKKMVVNGKLNIN
ncbi:MAG: alkaline phosphatase family protein [Bacteroidota bacterium]|nr:alkaline phosphatase family protein [Bacteroidota bacterium]